MNDLYGQKIGFLKLLLAYTYEIFGCYSGYKKIRWEEAERLVFICKGNICRSAYAEARAHQLMLHSASAGLGAIRNGPADPCAVKVAAKRNVNMSLHQTTPVSDFEKKDGDVFICMEPSQALSMRKRTSNNPRQQVTIIGFWSNNRRPYLQDPYGLCDGYWRTCLDIIDSALENISQMIPKAQK